MSNEDIDNAVQAAKRDMFSMRIKFAKREVSLEAFACGGSSPAAQHPPTCSAAGRLAGSVLAGWLGLLLCTMPCTPCTPWHTALHSLPAMCVPQLGAGMKTLTKSSERAPPGAFPR